MLLLQHAKVRLGCNIIMVGLYPCNIQPLVLEITSNLCISTFFNLYMHHRSVNFQRFYCKIKKINCSTNGKDYGCGRLNVIFSINGPTGK